MRVLTSEHGLGVRISPFGTLFVEADNGLKNMLTGLGSGVMVLRT